MLEMLQAEGISGSFIHIWYDCTNKMQMGKKSLECRKILSPFPFFIFNISNLLFYLSDVQIDYQYYWDTTFGFFPWTKHTLKSSLDFIYFTEVMNMIKGNNFLLLMAIWKKLYYIVLYFSVKGFAVMAEARNRDWRWLPQLFHRLYLPPLLLFSSGG